MKREIISGVIRGHEQGYAFLIPEDGRGYDYFIPHGDLRGAMHGDTVIAETTEGKGDRTTARVLKITERGINKIVGTYFTCKSGGFITPDDAKYFCDIFVPFGKGLHAKSGDKVIVRILNYPKKQNPEGIITEVLGRQFEKKAELRSILFNYDLPSNFEKSVLEEAERVAAITRDLSDRTDFTDKRIITIDGEDARDFDDAVSIEKKDGYYYLGVHIADVSEYVEQDSLLDDQAYKRGTSVYFPESVIPMLPERLCNDVCSLVEGKTRLTLSCIMKIDDNGEVSETDIRPSYIKSCARMTYTQVQAILDGKKDLTEKEKFVYRDLMLFSELADILIAKRDKNGSVDLESVDSVICVGNNGEIQVGKAVSDKAHRLIEEFMILANCSVAKYMFFAEAPFIYRVHDKPTEDRLNAFYDFIAVLGINAKRNKNRTYPKDFQLILKNAEDKPYYSVLNRVMLRTMQKAVYSPLPKEHFGLAETHYCHFTSPIRRYPDLVVHRIIKDFLKNGPIGLDEKYSDFVSAAAEYSSKRERNAQEAERSVDEYYKMLYISEYEGEEFEGIVSGVKEFGLFVELPMGIEGRVPVETLKGKRFRYNERSYTLSNGVISFRLGDAVRIKVAGVNLITRKAEFLLVNTVAKK